MSIVDLYNKIYKIILPPLLKFLVFFTPLLVFGGTKEIFEFPKMHFVYFIGGTIIWLFAVRKILQGNRIEQINKWVLLYIAATLVSTVFSTHTYTSVWGYYTRFNGGLVSVLVFFGLYIFLTNELTKERIIELVRIACLSVIPISVYGIWQHILGVERVFSTLGQANWLAAFLTMLIPCILFFAVTETKKKYMYLWGILYLLAFATLWFTYSLSGMLGLITSLIVFALLNKEAIRKHFKITLILAALSMLIAIVQPGIFGTKVKDMITDIRKIGHIYTHVYASESNASNNQLSDPGYIRTFLWKGTINMIKANPKRIILGTGPETFAYEFQKYRPQELNYSSEWNFVFNKPHNYYLELLSNTGLFGTIPYLAILVISLRKRDKFLTPGLVALYITNMFGWPTVTTTLLFWLFLAGVNKEK